MTKIDDLIAAGKEYFSGLVNEPDEFEVYKAICELHEENKRLRFALSFYLGGDDEGFNDWINKMKQDCGSVAQQTLGDKRDE